MRSCTMPSPISFAAIALIVAATSAAPTVRAAQADADGEPLVEPSPLVTGAEFSRRLLSPIAADDVSRFLQVDGRTLAPEKFEPGADRVDVYRPNIEPAAGYGLVVFVPPMDEFPLPSDWKRELDRRGLLVVVLRGAGNDADVIGRRIPLALHAHRFATTRWRIDPGRTYIAGFSGGARLAQRIAMGWPDVFTGSLQFAGSVIVGESRLPPPPADLMRRFRNGTRVVLVSGTVDGVNRRNDAVSRDRLRELCVVDVHVLVPPRLDHWVPDGRWLGKALDALETPASPPDAACEAAVQARIDAEVAAAAADADAGRAEAARTKLSAIDDRWGGLAAPASIELAHRIMAAGTAAPAATQ